MKDVTVRMPSIFESMTRHADAEQKSRMEVRCARQRRCGIMLSATAVLLVAVYAALAVMGEFWLALDCVVVLDGLLMLSLCAFKEARTGQPGTKFLGGLEEA